MYVPEFRSSPRKWGSIHVDVNQWQKAGYKQGMCVMLLRAICAHIRFVFIWYLFFYGIVRERNVRQASSTYQTAENKNNFSAMYIVKFAAIAKQIAKKGNFLHNLKKLEELNKKKRECKRDKLN